MKYEINPMKGTAEGDAANSEIRRQTLENKSFEERVQDVPESTILIFMKDSKMIRALTEAGLPMDRESCEVVGKEHDLGAEQIAAISRYQRSQTRH